MLLGESDFGQTSGVLSVTVWVSIILSTIGEDSLYLTEKLMKLNIRLKRKFLNKSNSETKYNKIILRRLKLI